jgi:hypothetical protein
LVRGIFTKAEEQRKVLCLDLECLTKPLKLPCRDGMFADGETDFWMRRCGRCCCCCRIRWIATAQSASQVMAQPAVPFGWEDMSIPRVVTEFIVSYAKQARLSNMFIHRMSSDGGPQMITNRKYIHLLLGETPLQKWIGEYERSHQHPLNRTLHTFGIPMIAISLPLFLLALLIRGFWKISLSFFIIGWTFQFVGHGIGACVNC